MSQPEEGVSHDDTSDSEFDEQTSSISLNQTELKQHKTWPSISSIMTLFSASRTDQESIDDETISEELTCPICQDIMNEVFSTKCGHSFCYSCLTSHLNHQPDCPLCRSRINGTDIHPNYQLNRLAEYWIKSLKKKGVQTKDIVKQIEKDSKLDHAKIAESLATHIPYEDLVAILSLAAKERKDKEMTENKTKKDLLNHFLTKLKKNNSKTINELLIENDFATKDRGNQEEQQLGFPVNQRKRRYSEILDSDEEDENDASGSKQSNTRSSQPENEDPLVQRLGERFYDLKDLYRNTLSQGYNIDKRKKLLSEFTSIMLDLTKYSRYKLVDKFNYAESRVTSTIVSSIELDRDEELFAVGGVTKLIKIYDYSMMGYYNNGIHCPVRVMECDQKISCLSYSPYIKSQIANSDYQGSIHIWDTSTGQRTMQLDEHKRRAWSVDISHQNPNILASASDDSTVKVWSVSQSDSVLTLEQKGNACCANFAPNNSNLLAVGTADHFVSCYDLRSPADPIRVYEGHQKAVSYVKWLNDEEIVSASTDSTLKLWDRETESCKRTYASHLNEKNFVGLSTNGNWISCGSETNTLYTYHKDSKDPITRFEFPSTNEKIDDNDDESPPVFVSSVCWKKGTNNILAANSKGIVTVLEME